MSEKTMQKMVSWIDDNIKENPTLRELSEYVGYSSFYSSNKFHEYVGVTFKQYKAKRRLDLAAMEIKVTDRRFLDIALDYGFSSQEAFSRAFANDYGCTPYQYRKKFRGSSGLNSIS